MQAIPQIVDDRTVHRALIAALLLIHSAAPPPAAAAPEDPRIVRFFDFEDAEAAPITFPAGFVNLADRYGLGRFGRIELDREHAASGNWSLRFEPDGISLIAGTPTGLIPVIPRADYAVTVQVRSERLVRGGVRVTAALHDVHGVRIPGGTRSSAIVRPGPEWSEVIVVLPGDHPEATDLTVELEVLQPDRLPRARGDAHRPLPADVGAVVWFDALTIRFDARVRLQPQNNLPVFADGQQPIFRAGIRDFAGDALNASLTVTDMFEEVIHHAALHAPRGGRPIDIALPILPPGWYVLTLQVEGDRGTVATRRCAFAVTPARRRAGGGHRTSPRFVVVHPWRNDEPLEGLASRMRTIAPDDVLIEVWHASMEEVDDPARLNALRTEVEQLTAMDIETGFVLGGLPDDLARSAGLDPENVLGLLAAPEGRGLRALESMLADSTLRTRRWQVGLRPDPAYRYGRPTAVHTRRLTALVRSIHPNPDVRLTRLPSAEPAPQSAAEPVSEVIALPATIAAHDVAEALAISTGERGNFESIVLEVPDHRRFSPEHRVIDMALRTIAAWTANPAELAVESPWTFDREEDVLHADPILPLWRGLSDMLGGRRFVGRIPSAPGVHVLMAEGSGPEDSALIVYAEHSIGEAVTGMIPLPGVTSHATAHDALGRRVALRFEEAAAFMVPGNLPVAIEGADLRVGTFMSTLAVDPPAVPWSRRISEHELVIENPWPTPITGTIAFGKADGIELSPRRVMLSVPAGERIRLPIEIRVERGAVSGVHVIPANVRLDADRPHLFTVPLSIETGWPDLDLVTSWRLIPNDQTGKSDLLVRLRVTNMTDRTLQLEANLFPPGLPRERRLIGRLEPASTTVRVFRILNGAEHLGGRSMLSSVQELNGQGRVNRIITVPPITESQRASVAADR